LRHPGGIQTSEDVGKTNSKHPAASIIPRFWGCSKRKVWAASCQLLKRIDQNCRILCTTSRIIVCEAPAGFIARNEISDEQKIHPR
jgi:hypothetical protein